MPYEEEPLSCVVIEYIYIYKNKDMNTWKCDFYVWCGVGMIMMCNCK